MSEHRAEDTTRSKRRRAGAVRAFALFLAVAGVGGGILATGPTGPLSSSHRYAVRPWLATGQPFGGSTINEIHFPARTRYCRSLGRAALTQMIDRQSHPQTSVSRCSGSRNLDPVCESGSSEVYFDIDDAAFGCTSGESCSWVDVASSVDQDDCTSRGAILVQNTFPPQQTRLTYFGSDIDPEVVVQIGDPIPDGDGATFQTLTAAATAGPYVVFSGGGTGATGGVYIYNYLLDIITTFVDDQMERPRGVGNFSVASSVDLLVVEDSVKVGWGDGSGVYTGLIDGRGAIAQPAAIGDTYAPGRQLGGSFSDVGFWEGTDRLVFRSFSQGFTYGVYSASESAPGVITRHADNETPAPGLGGNFTNCQRPSAVDDLVVFEGFGPTFQFDGIFADPDLDDGEVEPVLLRNQSVTLPGIGSKTVQTASTNESSLLLRGEAAILTYFTDGNAAILLARQSILIADFEENDFSEWSGTFPP